MHWIGSITRSAFHKEVPAAFPQGTPAQACASTVALKSPRVQVHDPNLEWL